MSKPAAPGGRTLSTRLRTAGKHSASSQRWLSRQLNDPYVAAAKQQGWRSRAAFKLLELDQRFRLIRPGMAVVDLGAAPGGWTQVVVRRGAASVLALDLLDMDPIPGALVIRGDFTEEGADTALIERLGRQVDLVLSDMAPNTTGHAATDHLRIMALAELALDFAVRVLDEGGSFVAKVFQGGSEQAMLDRMKRHFAAVRHAKPPASRKESSELYVVATGFRRDGSARAGGSRDA
jgi:23S rRNA (uridine2552-2'-O)-methyltransferase